MSLPPAVPTDEERSRWHLGGLLTIRATAAGTNGMVGIVEEHAERGYRTPPHVHSREDETLYVLSGEIEYTAGGVTGKIGAGDSAFLPRHRPHTFRVVSAEAHFLLVITPAGFEGFFGEVSPAAETAEVPGAGKTGLTDRSQMAARALNRDCRVFGSVAETLAAQGQHVATAHEAAGLHEAYTTIEELVTTSPDPLLLPPALVPDLIAAARRAGEVPVHARALLSLGILAERTGIDFGAEAAVLLSLADRAPSEAVTLALAYLFAHFPGQAEGTRAALSSRVLPEHDRLRLLRCLEEPDFAGRGPLASLGRVWPSRGTWTGVEPGSDREWRDALELDEGAIRALWAEETKALLAFLGARAEHLIVSGADVRS
ncbi:cupin domain-containing protein [Amycolatopsis jejuensis]|uniref:cupin domain-containing protein n=1 Tax=Amycolatopsis jejuensis TaxID=330084 RepID=UPI00068BB595|nr:cupin domain-containing protein [Amycolatopsis jejuensis]